MQDLNQDLYPDVCRISPKILWIYCFVGFSHFNKCCEKRPV